MENEVCAVCGGPSNVGDHNHGGDKMPADGGAAPAEGGSAQGDAAPAPEAKKPWWKFW